jgi:hypothetical protein
MEFQKGSESPNKSHDQIAGKLRIFSTNTEPNKGPFYVAVTASRWKSLQKFNDAISQVAGAIEPIDRSSVSVDEMAPRANAFYKGAIIGRYIASERFSTLTESELLRRVSLFSAGLATYNGDDTLQSTHEKAEQILMEGFDGYDELPEDLYKEILDELADSVNADPAVGNSFRAGIGFVYHTAMSAQVEKDLKEMETESGQIHDYDWDQGFSDFFGESE